MPTHLDLFTGIGGFALAAQWAGFETVGFCEREPYAQQVIKERFGAVLADAQELQRNGCEHNDGGNSKKRVPVSQLGNGDCPRLHPDIFTLNGFDYAGVDLITGGFPCQPFSVAGKRLGAADDRAIWPQMLRVVDEAKPAWLVGENVAGIVTMELDNVLSDLEAVGYAAWPLVVPACAVDARHRRDRVWIVAHATRELQHRRGQSRDGIGQHSDGSEDVADANGTLTQGNECAERGEQKRANPSQCCQWRNEGEWFAESGMGRVAHGIPNRAHRLRGLGNAIVPQVAFEILAAIRSQIKP